MVNSSRIAKLPIVLTMITRAEPFAKIKDNVKIVQYVDAALLKYSVDMRLRASLLINLRKMEENCYDVRYGLHIQNTRHYANTMHVKCRTTWGRKAHNPDAVVGRKYFSCLNFCN